MNQVFNDLTAIIASGLQPVAVAVILGMVMNNQLSATVGELSRLTNLHQVDVDHAALIIRVKKLGTYTRGTITLNDTKLLNTMAQIAEARKLPTPAVPEFGKSGRPRKVVPNAE